MTLVEESTTASVSKGEEESLEAELEPTKIANKPKEEVANPFGLISR